MKAARSKTFLLTVLICAVFTRSSCAQKIHVFMVADTADAKIGKYVERDVDTIYSTFRDLVPASQFHWYYIQSKKNSYSQQSIFEVIRRWQVNRNDSFVFIFSGHGGNTGKNHFMSLPNGGRLWSGELDDVVNAKRCRFRAAITSSCNNFARGARAAAGPGWNVKRNGIAPVMEELFFRHSGFLHTNSAWPGNYGWANWFLLTMFDYVRNTPTARPSWTSIDHMLDRELDIKFREALRMKQITPAPGQTHARPIMWDTPKHDGSGYRLGAFKSKSSKGVYITRVIANSPASRVLRPGDVVTSINGEEVRSSQDFSEFIARSPREMRFRYIRGDRHYDGTVQLAR